MVVWVFVGVVVFWSALGLALAQEEILVIANGNTAGSVKLARYYMKRRKIPGAHLLKLRTTDKEWCPRDAYDRGVADPVRMYLRKYDRLHRIRCLVTVYGVPMKINASAVEVEAKKHEAGENRRQGDLVGEHAALDSELALVDAGDYSLSGWMPNPLFLGYKNRELPIPRQKVHMVSCLDGPSPEIVQRIIDDSVAVEKKGLSGVAYFDARWPRPDGTLKSSTLIKYMIGGQSAHAGPDGGGAR
jgi:uncharacterized protein (TIGR03790 family)